MKSLSFVILTKGDQIFLQHRDNKAPTSPNTWGLWGGYIDEGEEPLPAAIRELKEELEIDISKEELTVFKTYQVERGGNDLTAHIFTLEDRGFVYRLHEGDGMEFWDLASIEDLEMEPIALMALQDYRKSIIS